MATIHLYIDDSGSRIPTRQKNERQDEMDHFALGGILILEDDVSRLQEAHQKFCAKWNLVDPLHSTKIRGRRGAFSWLGRDRKRAEDFWLELDEFVLSQPILAISCVIDRRGYLTRYEGKHTDPWMLCQTAYAILVERACKYARSRNAKLKIFFEEAGKKEDRAIVRYTKALKEKGMPFAGSREAGYDSLTAPDFKSILVH